MEGLPGWSVSEQRPAPELAGRIHFWGALLVFLWDMRKLALSLCVRTIAFCFTVSLTPACLFLQLYMYLPVWQYHAITPGRRLRRSPKKTDSNSPNFALKLTKKLWEETTESTAGAQPHARAA